MNSHKRAAFSDDFWSRSNLSQKITNLATHGYFSLMALALAMVGNSSSGIIEAPSFRLPVVNIGRRQEGRLKGANVIDVAHERASILEGIRVAIGPEFRAALKETTNPYGEGDAADRIIDRLKAVSLGQTLLVKKFADLRNVTAVPF